jgi:hypothetical protein
VYFLGTIIFIGTLMPKISGKHYSITPEGASNSTGVFYCRLLNVSRVTGQKHAGSDKWKFLEADHSAGQWEGGGDELWNLNFGFKNSQ